MTEENTSPKPSNNSSNKSLKQRVKMIALAVIVVLVLIFILQNRQPEETHLLFITVTAPRAVWLFGTLFVGFIIGAGTVLFRK